MFGIGETELLIILAFGFMIFGPDKLPGMGRTIGRALRQFRQAQEGFTEVVQTEVMDPLQQAMGDPLDTGTRAQRRSTAEERAAALAQDADIDDDGATEAPARKETFAERKARLAAEKKLREQEAAAEQAEEAPAEDADAAQAGEQEEAAEPAKPDTSASALYAMGGTSKFAAAKAQQVSAKAEQEAEAAPEAEAQPASDDSSSAQDNTDESGKEGEGE